MIYNYNHMIDDPNKLFTILSVSKLTSRLRSKITIPNKYLVSFTKVINFMERVYTRI
jgi:hypothetical protein